MKMALSLQTSENEQPETNWRRKEWIEPRLVVITLIAIILSYVGEANGWASEVILGLNITAYVAGGFYGAKTALTTLRKGDIDIDMLMILAALGAAIIGQWHEGAILLFLFSLSNVLQDYAIGRSQNAIKSLFKLYPESATIKVNDSLKVVKIEDIRVDDLVLIEPGERIPVDGVIVSGKTTVDQSPITGESIPIDKTIGDTVFAGTLNQFGVIDVQATSEGTQSTLARIIAMVQTAQNTKAPTENALDRFEQVYAKVILAGVGLFILIPPLLNLVEFDENFYRGMVLLTVASPCALIISVPSAFIASIASAARNGVLFKGGVYLERMAAAKVVTMDKTGTLTKGKPIVADVVARNGNERQLLAMAGAIEARSEHPLAEAIVEKTKAMGVKTDDIEEFEALPGLGVRGILHGQQILAGRPAHLENESPIPTELLAELERLHSEGKTVIGLLADGQWQGLLALEDELRAEAPEVIKELHEMGVKVAMLTGDNQAVAHAVAERLGIDEVHAELMPEEKVERVQELQERIGDVVMVGDGVNDAPALATASVGIAMGGTGTDAALETADIALMNDKLSLIPYALNLAKKTRRVVWQNIIFSLSVIVILVISVFAINLPLTVGVFGHEGSTVIVVLNSLIALLLIPEYHRRRAMR